MEEKNNKKRLRGPSDDMKKRFQEKIGNDSVRPIPGSAYSMKDKDKIYSTPPGSSYESSADLHDEAFKTADCIFHFAVKFKPISEHKKGKGNHTILTDNMDYAKNLIKEADENSDELKPAIEAKIVGETDKLAVVIANAMAQDEGIYRVIEKVLSISNVMKKFDTEQMKEITNKAGRYISRFTKEYTTPEKVEDNAPVFSCLGETYREEGLDIGMASSYHFHGDMSYMVAAFNICLIKQPELGTVFKASMEVYDSLSNDYTGEALVDDLTKDKFNFDGIEDFNIKNAAIEMDKANEDLQESIDMGNPFVMRDALSKGYDKVSDLLKTLPQDMYDRMKKDVMESMGINLDDIRDKGGDFALENEDECNCPACQIRKAVSGNKTLDEFVDDKVNEQKDKTIFISKKDLLNNLNKDENKN